ncbi:MAG TPA: CdaR family protein [Pyrinomonadaceae bacterium]|nr:CdaR family protein [Pyrinomonadaceae bacterium]
MPFQDTDDEEVITIPKAPSVFERAFRRVFLQDWGLKLLALLITVALWLAVTGQNKPVTLRVSGVQLNFLRHEGLEISNDLPTTVEVVLSGSPAKLDRIGPRDLIATVDISDQKAGERIVRLSRERVQMDLPDGVTLQGFHPATIPVRLEPRLETQLTVEVKFEGSVADGYEVSTVSVNPAKVRVRGPADKVASLRQATTETVSLDGKKESFALSNVAINIPDPRIDLIDPAVDIRVEIVEKKRGDVHLTFASAKDRVAMLVYRQAPHLLN